MQGELYLLNKNSSCLEKFKWTASCPVTTKVLNYDLVTSLDLIWFLQIEYDVLWSHQLFRFNRQYPEYLCVPVSYPLGP